MSLFGLFDIGKTALFASQTALTVSSNNIANVNTPGYSRQEVVLSIANPVATAVGSIGRGVTVESIKRNYDSFIQSQLMGQEQSQGKSAAMDDAWGQVEQVFNEAGGIGLSSPMAEFFNAWSDVADNPDSSTPRTVLLQKAGALVTSARGMERSMLSTVNSANAGIVDSVRQVNTLATNIADLNQQIMQVEAGSNTEKANDLRDQRDAKLNELASLVDFSSFQDSNGSLTIIVGMRNLVAGDRTSVLSTTLNNEGSRDLSLDGMNITSNIQKGRISGLIDARNDIQSGALTGLRKLVASVTQEVNILHASGFGLDASTGNDFFNPLQLTTTNNSAGAGITAVKNPPDPALLPLDEYKITFSAGNYTVTNKQTGSPLIPPVFGLYVSGGTISLPGIDVVITGPVTAADSFIVSPITSAVSGFGVAVSDPRSVAASSTLGELPGNNVNALQIARLTAAAVNNLGNSTFSDYYGGLVSTVGVKKQAASDSLTFDNNLLTALKNRREALSGVSLDEEATNLIRYQRSYQAGARMITVADELIQTVLNL